MAEMAGQPLRIVHCLRAPVGGLFRHVCDLAQAQAARGHLVGIIADASTGGDAADARFDDLAAVCKLGIKRIPMARIPGPGDFSAILRVKTAARAWSPDVLHGHGAKGGAYARIAGNWLKRAGRPVLAYTPHGGSLHYSASSPIGFIYLALERYLARRTDVFLFESQYGERVFREKICSPGGVVRVAHNGLAPAEFAPVTPDADAADFLYVGELRTLKGIDTLLHALVRLDPGPQGPRAVIVGAGGDGAALEQLAAELGLADRVSFPGPMPARSAFPLGSCIVVPSRAESLPYIVLEAAAAQLPMVATNVGGISEIFGPQTPRLIPPDDPAALASAMQRLQRDPESARAEAADLAADVSERFSLVGMADQILSAYRAAI